MSRSRGREQDVTTTEEHQTDGLLKPPYYVITRGERANTGCDTLVLGSHRDGAGGVIAAFSSAEKALRYVESVVIPLTGPGHDWRVARLPTWPDIVGFLRSCPGLTYICMDPVRLPDPMAVCHRLAVLMPLFEFLADDPLNN